MSFVPAVIVWRGKRVLLVQRPSGGRWSGLWEFPHGPVATDESDDQAARRLLRDLAGIEIDVIGERETLRHRVTRFAITLVCLEAGHRSGQFRSEMYRAGKWLTPEAITGYAVSAPQRRLARLLIDASSVTRS